MGLFKSGSRDEGPKNPEIDYERLEALAVRLEKVQADMKTVCEDAVKVTKNAGLVVKSLNEGLTKASQIKTLRRN